jgi:hypothetical protein
VDTHVVMQTMLWKYHRVNMGLVLVLGLAPLELGAPTMVGTKEQSRVKQGEVKTTYSFPKGGRSCERTRSHFHLFQA